MVTCSICHAANIYLQWPKISALVMYDLNRAVRLPHTHDNAIDSAVAIYLDFINIFIRLLAVIGQEK